MSDLLAQLQSIPADSVAAFALVALAGLVMGVAPSSLPLMSVVVGTVAAREDTRDRAAERRALLFAGGFVLGIATVDAALGAVFGFAGDVVIRALAGSLALTNLLLAALLVVIGLALLRVIRVPWLRLDARPREVASFGGAYALGIPFGLSACPACTPMVLPILGAAAATGEAWLGAALLFVFGLARGVPLVAAGVATGTVKHLRRAAPLVPRIERVGGVLVLLAAVLFLYQSAAYAGLVPPLWFVLDM